MQIEKGNTSCTREHIADHLARRCQTQLVGSAMTAINPTVGFGRAAA